jgi:hypothetical protein
LKSHRPKTIVFFADSLTNFLNYEKLLASEFDCHWTTFREGAYQELIDLGKGPVQYLSLDPVPFKNRYLIAVINIILDKLGLKFKFSHWLMKRHIQRIEREISPDIIISDTGLLLEKIETMAMKMATFHGISFKVNFLHPCYLAYDFLPLPSQHFKNILEQKLPQVDRRKFKIVGWPRSDDLVIDQGSDQQRSDFLCELGLDSGKKTLLYAPTHDSFDRWFLFPKNFGNTLETAESLAKFAQTMNLNFIVKVHHFRTDLCMSQELRATLEKFGGLLLPNSKTYHSKVNNQSFIRYSDILISDTSGIIADYLIFDRPIIYLRPDAELFSFEKGDLDESFRAGHTPQNLNELQVAIHEAIEHPDQFQEYRQNVRNKLFLALDGQSTRRSIDGMLDRYSEYRNQQ